MAMKCFVADLQSITALSQGRNHGTPKLPQELEQAYEERTVLAKLHTATDQIYIPPIAFKLCLEKTASYLGEKIPGHGSSTYTKHYRQGVMCPDPIMLGLTVDKVRIDKVFIPTQPGKPNSGRAWKWFPLIDQWQAELRIIALDDIFTQSVIERHLKIAGQMTGIGVWRPERGGMQGKFHVVNFQEREL
jgi:hypothetical protein